MIIQWADLPPAVGMHVHPGTVMTRAGRDSIILCRRIHNLQKHLKKKKKKVKCFPVQEYEAMNI